jgi:peptidoglycan/LPS O-acetylase OafA/YrhL
MNKVISSLGNLWNLLLFVAIVFVLAGFVYFFFLRRLMRMRRIALARSRRLLREAAERE